MIRYSYILNMYVLCLMMISILSFNFLSRLPYVKDSVYGSYNVIESYISRYRTHLLINLYFILANAYIYLSLSMLCLCSSISTSQSQHPFCARCLGPEGDIKICMKRCNSRLHHYCTMVFLSEKVIVLWKKGVMI